MTIQIGTATGLGLQSDRITAFYGTTWKRPIILSNQDFYDWQFKSGPLAGGFDNCIVAYDAARGVVAGVLGLNARPFHLAGERRTGAELTTWVVGDQYRSLGIGVPMLDHAMKTYDILTAMGITKQSLPVFLRSGFRYLSAIPRFIRVFDFDAIASISTIEPLARKLGRQWTARQFAVPYEVTEGLPSKLAKPLERMASGYNMFSRDLDHLNWRYAKHPTFAYRTFLVESRGKVAFIAVRLETAVAGMRILHVTDLVGDDAAISAAFSFLADFCRQESIHVADLYCTAAHLNCYPISQGWFSVMDHSGLQFPHVFHPVEMRFPATTSLVFWSREDFTEMCDLSKLYVTKQDADFDRPIAGP